MTDHQNMRGFTLVELLIVAIILAILAAIVIPQFASTTDDAKNSALRSNLATMRSAIDLYQQQHTALPGASPSSGGTCSATAGSGATGSEQAVIDQLTRYSNLAGQTCSAPEAGFIFGPYLRDDEIPQNPVSNDSTVVIVNTGDLNLSAPAAGGGWRYDTVSGKFIADDNSADSSGTTYDSY